MVNGQAVLLLRAIHCLASRCSTWRSALSAAFAPGAILFALPVFA